MKDAYDDIRSRIDEPPKWFDVHGTPRYGEPNVPGCLLDWIACQACQALFRVSLADPVYIAGMGNRNVERVSGGGETHLQLAEDWRYGDPPRHGCVGGTMCSIPRRHWGRERWSGLPDPDDDEELFFARSICSANS